MMRSSRSRHYRQRAEYRCMSGVTDTAVYHDRGGHHDQRDIREYPSRRPGDAVRKRVGKVVD